MTAKTASLALALGAALAVGQPAFADEEALPRWVHAESSGWVDRYDITELIDSQQSERDSSVTYLFYDRQLNAANDEYYVHVAYRITNESGVQTGSQVSVNFFPSFQTVTFHDMSVIRDNEKINRWDSDKIKMLQREQNLDQYIYNEASTLISFLEDVRKDDVIEYSYTVKGINPVFEGRFFAEELMQWTVPIGYSRLRFLHPLNRSLNIEYHGGDYQPKITETPDYKEYIWEVADSSAIVFEDNVPGWYNPFPWIQITEFESWNKFRDWIDELYEIPGSVSESLEAKIAEFKALNVPTEEKISSVIRFLQDEIRYLGIELGAGSYIPSDPSEVYERRYGDCKDKAILLGTILSRLDIESHPVLVHSSRLNTIAAYAPSPLNFNHVIVKIDHQGKELWVDPTISAQGGPLESLELPPYGLGIIIGGSPTSRLIEIGADKSAPGEIEIFERYTLADTEGEADIETLIMYRNREADFTRTDIRQMSRKDFDDYYLNYYASMYPDIRQVGALEVFDDIDENTIEISALYRADNFWQLFEEDNALEAGFTPPILYDILTKPEVVLRKMPYAMYYPLILDYRIEISLPEVIQMEDFIETINNDFFKFRTIQRIIRNEKKVLLSYRLETLKDSVPADRISEYIKAVDKVYGYLSFYVTFYSDESQNAAQDQDTQFQTGPEVFGETFDAVVDPLAPASASPLPSMMSMLSMFLILLIRMISMY